MYSFKKIAVVLTTIMCGFGVTAFAFAQVSASQSLNINHDGSAKITGKVTAISGSTISVASWGGTWSINAANAIYVPPGKLSLSQIAVGDTIVVHGTVTSGMSITAMSIKDKTVNPPQKALSGTISSINVAAGTFTLTSKNGNAVTVATNANTKITLNGNVTTLATISSGSKATVLGTWNAAGTTVTAISVKVPAVKASHSNAFGFWFGGHVGQLLKGL